MGITRLRSRFPSPALIVACLALFAALGGSTYAATQSTAHRIHFTNASLKNSWVNFGSLEGPAGYAKDSLGVVHLRGLIVGGSSDTTAFALPKSMRPKHYLYLPIYVSNHTVGTMEIHPDGSVVPVATNAKLGSSLDGVSFVAGQ